MKTISKIILWTGIPSIFILFSYLFSVTYSEAQISREVWYSFEPEESYTLEGSRQFINDRKSMEFYTNVPNFLGEIDRSKNSLGVKVSWDRRGSHFADIIPADRKVVDGTLYRSSLWVWGGNYLHELALIFSRPDGFSYGVPLGNLAFYGWRHIRSDLPAVISSSGQQYVDGSDAFSFQAFRIYTHPLERVNDIYVFLDEFDVDREVTLRIYDGYDLTKIIQENQSESESESQSQSQSQSESDSPK